MKKTSIPKSTETANKLLLRVTTLRPADLTVVTGAKQEQATKGG